MDSQIFLDAFANAIPDTCEILEIQKNPHYKLMNLSKTGVLMGVKKLLFRILPESLFIHLVPDSF